MLYGVALGPLAAKINQALGHCLCIGEDNIGLYARTVSLLMPGGVSSSAPEIAAVLATAVGVLDSSLDDEGSTSLIYRVLLLCNLATLITTGANGIEMVFGIDQPELAVELGTAIALVDKIYVSMGGVRSATAVLPEVIDAVTTGIGAASALEVLDNPLLLTENVTEYVSVIPQVAGLISGV
jgi:hypothetical protein